MSFFEPVASNVPLGEQRDMYMKMCIEMHRSKQREIEQVEELYQRELTRVKMEAIKLQQRLDRAFEAGMPVTTADCFYLGFKRIWRSLWRKNRRPASATEKSYPFSRR